MKVKVINPKSTFCGLRLKVTARDAGYVFLDGNTPGSRYMRFNISEIEVLKPKRKVTK